MICPRCTGNGYIRVKKDVSTDKDVDVQCPMCQSEGEIKDENDNNDYIHPSSDKLQ